MMNLMAIGLITASLAVAGFLSPNPQAQVNNGGREQVIVKEGHRAVVVEYADTAADGNTKVLISPPQTTKAEDSIAGVAQDVKGKAKEALTAPDEPHGAGAKEVICDAFGKCKDKITGAWSKAKEKAVEAEEEVVDKAKDMASRATHTAEERAEGVRQNAKEKVKEAGEAVERVKENAEEKARETTGKVKEKTGEVVEETAEKIKKKGRESKKELSDIARRGKEVIFDVLGYIFWPESVGSLMGMVHILGFAMAYGISVWVTFIMSHVLAGVLPRQQFGMVQSKIYPVYFKAMVGSIGLALLGHLMGQRGRNFKNEADMLQGYILVSSLLLVLANLLFLEPRATKVMFERMKLEKEEGRGRDDYNPRTRVVDTDAAGPIPTTTTSPTLAATKPPPSSQDDEAKSKVVELDNRLKKLNSYSSLLNITTLMGLTWHLVYLSQRLVVDTS